jgi:hypothetical protein
MEKKKYESPSITVLIPGNEDILTTSFTDSNGFDGEVDDNW